MARPKLLINEDQVHKLAAINCTMEEIAAVLDCSVDTLERRFAEIIKKGRDSGKMSLRRKQFEVALGGNVGMLIWLGKQLLGQKDVSRVELHEIPDDMFQKEAERRLSIVKDSSGVS